MNGKIFIDKRFRGPETSGNGGYVCGMLGGFIDGAAEVTLRIPPPLEEFLDVDAGDTAKVILRRGETIVAEARPAGIELDVPRPPSFGEAVESSKNYLGFTRHPFPTCFVCGPDRGHGDGLRIFAGPVTGQNMVASPWVPDASLSNGNGFIRPEFIWASLDCPGAFAIFSVGPRVAVLGKMAAKILHQVRPGEKCVVIGWNIAIEGRKLHAGTALFSGDGSLSALSKATWIDLKKV